MLQKELYPYKTISKSYNQFELFSIDKSSCIKILVTFGKILDFIKAHRRYATLGCYFKCHLTCVTDLKCPNRLRNPQYAFRAASINSSVCAFIRLCWLHIHLEYIFLYIWSTFSYLCPRTKP